MLGEFLERIGFRRLMGRVKARRGSDGKTVYFVKVEEPAGAGERWLAFEPFDLRMLPRPEIGKRERKRLTPGRFYPYWETGHPVRYRLRLLGDPDATGNDGDCVVVLDEDAVSRAIWLADANAVLIPRQGRLGDWLD